MATQSTSVLPTELLGIILSFLSRRELIDISPVSRAWRRAGRIDPRFWLEAGYSHHRFDDRRVQLQRIIEASQHALDHGIKLCLWFNIHTGAHDWWCDNEVDATLPIFEVFCRVLKRTLHIVINLIVFAPESWEPSLVGPAPHLRAFYFGRNTPGRIDPVVLFPAPHPKLVPRTLFAAYAPQLRTLQLVDAAPRAPLPVFRQVVELALVYTNYSLVPSMRLSDHFPALKSFRLKTSEDACNLKEAVPLKLGNLMLDRLDVQDRAKVFSETLSILETGLQAEIPIVVCRNIEQHKPSNFMTFGMTGNGGTMFQVALRPPNLEISGGDYRGTILVASTMGAQRPRHRVYIDDYSCVDLPFLFSSDPQLGEQLVQIQLEYPMVKSFVQVGINLPRLSTIDFWIRNHWECPCGCTVRGSDCLISEEDIDLSPRLTVPSLSVFRLTAFDGDCLMPRRFVYRLLAQFITLQLLRPRLELAGVYLVGPYVDEGRSTVWRFIDSLLARTVAPPSHIVSEVVEVDHKIEIADELDDFLIRQKVAIDLDGWKV